MKKLKEYIKEQLANKLGKKVKYQAHDYYGSPAKKVLARRSGSSAGGGSGGGSGGNGA